MRIVHIIVGSHNATTLQDSLEPAAAPDGEELFVCHDLLNFGPLRSAGNGFSDGRSQYATQCNVTGKTALYGIDDLERLMQLSTRLTNGEPLQLWYWMGTSASDYCTYFWLLHYLKKHEGKLSIVNIAGLPFIDENGKLFYPSQIAGLPQKEIRKARKLARVLTAAEWETDRDEWTALVAENAALRIHQGGKKLRGVSADYFDNALQAQLSAGKKPQKAVQEVIEHYRLPNGTAFLNWRLHLLDHAAPHADNTAAENISRPHPEAKEDAGGKNN